MDLNDDSKYDITGLHPNTRYTFSVSYITAASARTQFSKETEPVRTRLFLPPADLKERESAKTKSSIIIQWRTPQKIAEGVKISMYEITVLKGDFLFLILYYHFGNGMVW